MTNAAGEDRRRDGRQQNTGLAWIYSPTSTNPSDRAEVTGVNLSKHGIAFNARHIVPTHSFLKIELDLHGRRVVQEILIIHCEAVTSDHYNVGAEFC